MKETWLIIDGNNLAHRAYYALRQLRNDKQIGTGIIFGFFRDISFLMDRFGTDNVCFCFDDGEPLRRSIYPNYKSRERNQDICRPIEELKHQYLEQAGFSNIFFQAGYEGDDIVAHQCKNLGRAEAVIISEDQDFYQCLSDKVCIYKPRAKKLYTMQHLYNEYLITPKMWAEVKAISGCDGDCVEGITGVGELTAAKYLTGKLPTHHLAYKRIIDGQAQIKRNRNLVTLPFPGLSKTSLQTDKVTKEGWEKLCADLGMSSLVNHPPILSRSKRRSLF